MTKHIFITLLLIVLLPLVSFAQDIADELKLKCPKEKILSSKLLEDEYIIDEKGKEKLLEPFINYSYISETKVSQQTEGKLKEDITKRTKNSLHFPVRKVGNREEWIGKFFTGDTFYQADDEWYQIEWATTTPDAFEKQTKEKHSLNILSWVYADNLSIEPDHGDGYVGFTALSGSSWWGVRTTDTGTAVNYSSAAASPFCTALWLAEGVNMASIYRGYFPTDTSSLPDTCTIIDAIFGLYVTATTDEDNDGEDTVNLVQTDQPDPTLLAKADYNNCGGIGTPVTTGATAIDISGITINTYIVFTLNATGLGWISKTGYTMLGMREGHDISGNSPASGCTNNVTGYPANKTSLMPYLSVNYTVASARRPILVQ